MKRRVTNGLFFRHIILRCFSMPCAISSHGVTFVTGVTSQCDADGVCDGIPSHFSGVDFRDKAVSIFDDFEGAFAFLGQFPVGAELADKLLFGHLL